MEIPDNLIDLLIQVVHNIGKRAENKVDKKLLEDLKLVHGKTGLLFKLAEVAVAQPEGIIKDVLYPKVSLETLKNLVKSIAKLAEQSRLTTTSPENGPLKPVLKSQTPCARPLATLNLQMPVCGLTNTAPWYDTQRPFKSFIEQGLSAAKAFAVKATATRGNIDIFIVKYLYSKQ